MEIITSELPHPIDEKVADVVRRVIHTTADFDYADNLYFSTDVCEKTVELLKQGGVTIVTDTNMAFSGCQQGRLQEAGCGGPLLYGR